MKRSADRLGEQNMIVHDQDANRCSSFPSTGNSIWKIVGKPYGEATRLDLRALAPERSPPLIFLLLTRRRTERTVTQLEPHPQDEGHLAARRRELIRLVRRRASSEHGSRCHLETWRSGSDAVVVDCVVIEGDDREELARF